MIAIQLTNASSVRGFETALDTVSGRASIEIVGTGRHRRDAAAVARLAARVRAVSPVIEGEMALVHRAGGPLPAAAQRSGQGAGRRHPARPHAARLRGGAPDARERAGAERAAARRRRAHASQPFLELLDQPAERRHHREAGPPPRLRARRRDPADDRRPRRTPMSSARCWKTRARRG